MQKPSCNKRFCLNIPNANPSRFSVLWSFLNPRTCVLSCYHVSLQGIGYAFLFVKGDIMNYVTNLCTRVLVCCLSTFLHHYKRICSEEKRRRRRLGRESHVALRSELSLLCLFSSADAGLLCHDAIPRPCLLERSSQSEPSWVGTQQPPPEHSTVGGKGL